MAKRGRPAKVKIVKTEVEAEVKEEVKDEKKVIVTDKIDASKKSEMILKG